MPGTAIRLDIADGTATITAALSRLRGVAPHEAYDGLNDLYAAFRRVGSLAVPFALSITTAQAVATGLATAAVTPSELPQTVTSASKHLAADPALARALVETLRRTVLDPTAWDQAVEVERARPMSSLSRPRRPGRAHLVKES